MNQDILSAALRQEHKRIGLYLSLEGDCLFLYKEGKLLPVAVFKPTSPIEDILFAADQAVEWSRSGISFEKEN